MQQNEDPIANSQAAAIPVNRCCVLLFFAVFFAASCAPGPAPVSGSIGTISEYREAIPLPPAPRRDVIVQLFNWPFAKITGEIPLLAVLGYAQIHVSPPNLTIDSDQWWGRYQPVDYRVIAGPLGSQAEFQEMIRIAHRHGIKIIVDVVLNHTAHEKSPLSPEAAHIVKRQGVLFTPADYHAAFCIRDYSNTDQVRNGRLCGGEEDTGLPDLDQNSEQVLKVQTEFLGFLSRLGADGFRLDAVKHMEPGYFHRLLTAEITDGKFIFGEVITTADDYERELEPYMSATSIAYYDFLLRDTLQSAFAPDGDLSVLVSDSLVLEKHALPPQRSVAFIMNHDIPNNDVFHRMILDPVSEKLAYTYILAASRAIPYIFSDLGRAGGGGIRDDRWAYAHRSAELAAMLYFHNYTYGTGVKILQADRCTIVFQRGGQGIGAVNKCDKEYLSNIETDLPDGEFYDLIGRRSVHISKSRLEIRIPPRCAQLFIKK